MDRSGADDIPQGWARLTQVARELDLDLGMIKEWGAKNLVPNRKIGGGRYVPVEGIRELTRAWSCQLCRRECYGPGGLSDHLNGVHMFEAMAFAVEGLPQRYDYNVPWPCPDESCPRRTSPFAGCPALVEHLRDHAQDRKSRGIGERQPKGNGGQIGRRPYQCRHPGCGVVTKPGRGAARGLCSRHYKQALLAGKFKRRADDQSNG